MCPPGLTDCTMAAQHTGAQSAAAMSGRARKTVAIARANFMLGDVIDLGSGGWGVSVIVTVVFYKYLPLAKKRQIHRLGRV